MKKIDKEFDSKVDPKHGRKWDIMRPNREKIEYQEQIVASVFTFVFTILILSSVAILFF